MRNLKNKSVKSGYILTSVILCAAGLFLILFPGFSAKMLCLVAGILFLVFGGINLLSYWAKGVYRELFMSDLIFGIFALILGLIMVLRPEGVLSILHFILGAVIFADGIAKVKTSVDARRFGISYWWVSALLAAVTIVFGVLILVNPFQTASVIMAIIGVSLLIEGGLNLINSVYYDKICCSGDKDVIVLDPENSEEE